MMRGYKKYKPSGVEWINEIPSHWASPRIKSILEKETNGIWGEEKKHDENDVYCIRVADFDRGFDNLSDLDNTIRNVAEKDFENRKLDIGDLLIEKSGGGDNLPVGRVGVYTWKEKKAVCSNFMTRLRINLSKASSKYLFYYFKKMYAHRINVKSIKQTTGLQNLDTYSYFNERLPLPTVDEQIVITKFLDEKTAQLDTLIEKKQTLIKLLREERSAIINQAVNKGINESVRLKATKIEWVSIPEHWRVSRVSYIAKVVRGASPRPAGDPTYFNGDHTPWITVGELTKDENKYLTVVSEYLTEEGAKLSRFIEPGTLLLSNSGATLGVPKILKIGGCINDGSVAFLNLSDKVVIDFLYYFFKSLTEIYRDQMSGYGQPNLNTDIVKETQFCYPETDEQLEIVKHIETRTSQITATISRVWDEIKLLQEYRTSLISEVVTGKIKVI